MLKSPKTSILLVEDNPADVELFKELLGDQPEFAIEAVPRLSQAMDRAQKKTYDVVFLDLYLLDSKGLETLEDFHEAFPYVAVVAMTGLDDSELMPRVLKLGAIDCLQKGKELNASTIKQMIANALVHRVRSKKKPRPALFNKKIDSTTDHGQASSMRYHLLFLDDNPSHSELLCESLTAQDQDFDVESCQNPKDFFNKVAHAKYDLFLIDFHLGEFTGLEVARRLHEMGSKTPIVVLSSAMDENLISQCRAEGIPDFVLKTRTAFSTLPQIIRRRIQLTGDEINPNR